MTKARSGSIRAALLDWYDTNRRDLPWRATSDPYCVWVSEVMLQQTRVDAVLPYYERWLAAFPDINALADADVHDVLKQWEGLGYYSRARNLHGAARLVREQYAGRVPSEYALLRALPGVGDYTAGAIASIAFQQRTPAVDGNARRVVSRLFDLADPPPARLRTIAAELLDPERPGDFNQAVMDLGATVCTPQEPVCASCPLAALCISRMHGTTHQRPRARPRKPIPHFHVATLIALRNGSVLLEQRAGNGLLAGLWQFPEISEIPADARLLGEVTHTFSHKRVTYTAYIAQGYEPAQPGWQWVELTATRTYPMSAAQRRIELLVSQHAG